MPPTATAFGRRSAPAAPPAARAPPRPATLPAPAAADLSSEAEAFRATLAADRGGERNDAFGDWRRSKNWERWLMWGVRLFSFTPGLISFAVDAPLELSIGLEIAAFVGNVWFRATRWRRMREIVAWTDPSERD